MNAALKICQAMHDAQLPPMVSESPREVARAEWLHSATEDLLRGVDVKFQRRMRQPQTVTFAQFAVAVDEHVNNRLAGCEITHPALGYLVIDTLHGQPAKADAIELLGLSDHPQGALGEIAQALLEPLADDALIAQAEDDAL
jgi:hypothetical protein